MRGEKEACCSFEVAEIIEFDLDEEMNQELIKEIKNLTQTNGKVDPEKLETLLTQKSTEVYFKKMPVEPYIITFKNGTTQERQQVLNNLIGAVSFGNLEARQALLEIFKFLPEPQTLEEVRFKIDLFERMNIFVEKEALIPLLMNELYQTPSNNTTRQWFSAIFRFLQRCPLDGIREPLENMLRDKRFSYRIKERIRNILNDKAMYECEVE